MPCTNIRLNPYRASFLSNNAAIDTPSDEESSSSIKMSGQESQRSHFDTACGVTPSSSATSRCFLPDWRRKLASLRPNSSVFSIDISFFDGSVCKETNAPKFFGDLSFALPGVFLLFSGSKIPLRRKKNIRFYLNRT